MIATKWLAALRDHDITRLAEATSYPFAFRDTGRDARCGKRTANGPDMLAAAIDCLFRSEQLRRAMANSPAPDFRAAEPARPEARRSRWELGQDQPVIAANDSRTSGTQRDDRSEWLDNGFSSRS